MILQSPFSEGIFLGQLKVANIFPWKTIGNYRPRSALLIFSKVFERIMYNRTYQYFKENNMLFPNQFCFQINNLTRHVILNLTNDRLTSFEKSQLTLGVFIDISKEFDAVNHSILLHRLELCGIIGKCLN